MEILTPEDEAAIEYEKSRFLEEGVDITDYIGGSVLKNLQRFLMLLAYNFMTAAETPLEYDFKRDMNEAEKNKQLIKIFKKFCIDFVLDKGFWGDGEYKYFKENYLKPLFARNSKFDNVPLPILLYKSVPDRRKGSGGRTTSFVEYAKDVIARDSGPTKASFLRLVRVFEAEYLVDGKPPSGVQWDDLLNLFRCHLLFKTVRNKHNLEDSKILNKTTEKKRSGVNADEIDGLFDSEESENVFELKSMESESQGFQEKNDTINELERIRSQNKQVFSPGLIPDGDTDMAWLLFVFYGPYGVTFGVDECIILEYLKKNEQKYPDLVKRGRSEARKSLRKKGKVTLLISHVSYKSI